MYRFFCLLLCAISLTSFASAEDDQRLFSTWEGFEVDKCASIWLIKRFIEKDARFSFLPKGTRIEAGIAFDTPDAELRRYHNLSTFESILNHFNIKDPHLHAIGKLIHDIEINTWERKRFNETYHVMDAIRAIISESKNRKTVIKRSLDYFDDLYRTLKQ